MQVQVLYFQSIQKIAGRSEEAIDLGSGSSIEDLLSLLAERYPDLGPALSSLMLAVNEDHALRTTILNEGDRVAVMPPFSGG